MYLYKIQSINLRRKGQYVQTVLKDVHANAGYVHGVYGKGLMNVGTISSP